MARMNTQIPNAKKYSIGFRFARILCLKRRFIDSAMKSLDMTRVQWQTLHWLNTVSPCTQKQLLCYMDVDAGQLARTLDEFEKNNIISRKPLPEDRRCLLVELTSHAKKKLIPHLEKVLEMENTIFLKEISASDQKKLSTLLEKIENNICSEVNKIDGKKS